MSEQPQPDATGNEAPHESANESADAPELTSIHVHQAVEGDMQSYDWLIRRFAPLLLAQASNRLGPHLRRWYDPEDIVQEVWAVALPRLAGLTPRDGRLTPVVLKFLSTTVLYRVQNLLQKHLRAGAGESVEKEVGATFSQLPDETSQLISRAIRHERKDALWQAIEQLPELDREIVVQRGIEQNPVQEIAMLLNEKPNTITVRYRRALERLRTSFPESVLAELTAEE